MHIATLNGGPWNRLAICLSVKCIKNFTNRYSDKRACARIFNRKRGHRFWELSEAYINYGNFAFKFTFLSQVYIAFFFSLTFPFLIFSYKLYVIMKC